MRNQPMSKEKLGSLDNYCSILLKKITTTKKKEKKKMCTLGSKI